MIETPFHLTGKTILITGSSSGIGAQCAISISKMGGNVIITGRNEKNLKIVFEKLTGNKNKYITCDLTIEDDIKNLALEVPALDGIVHCAGIVTVLPSKYINNINIQEIFKINYVASVLLMTNLFKLRKINDKSSIVFLSSISASFPFSGGALYAGSKVALEKYSQVLATEYASKKIRSNCISPALVKTEILENSFKGDREKYKQQIESKHLLGFGETEDVANLVVFLLSNASKWLTGQNIILDGGYLLGLISKMSID